jgi:hypothetical protein
MHRPDLSDPRLVKIWLSSRDDIKGTLSANTYGQRLRMLGVFFARLIEWDWPDAPPRNPVIGGDIPVPPRPAGSMNSSALRGSGRAQAVGPLPPLRPRGTRCKAVHLDKLTASSRCRATMRASMDDFKHPWRHAREHGYDLVSYDARSCRDW